MRSAGPVRHRDRVRLHVHRLVPVVVTGLSFMIYSCMVEDGSVDGSGLAIFLRVS